MFVTRCTTKELGTQIALRFECAADALAEYEEVRKANRA